MPKTVLTITEVSRRLGVSTKTIRVYADEGFISLQRVSGRCLIDQDDLQELVALERLKRDLGVNLPGLGVIMEMRRKMLEMQERLEAYERDFEKRLNKALSDQRKQLDKPLSPLGKRSIMIIEEDD